MEYSLTLNSLVTPAQRDVFRLRAVARPTSGSGCTGWPTPKAGEDNRTPEQYLAFKNAHGASNISSLQVAAKLAGWPTPNVPTRGAESRESKDNRGAGGLDLQTTASLAGWATPAARDIKSESATDEFNEKRWNHTRGKPLSAEATQALGPTSSSSPAGTERRGVLSPVLPCWMMGFPIQWIHYAPVKAKKKKKD
jgi:hypothetical protein